MATRQSQGSGGSDTYFADAPAKPPILRMKLTAKKQTVWERFQAAISGLSPQAILEHVQSTRSEIEKKVAKGEYITDEEIEFLNRSMEEQLTELLDKFKGQALATTKIERSDTTQEIKFKLEFQKGLLDWLSELFDWVIRKISEIFAKIKEAVEWAFQKAKELFEYLWSFFQ